MKARNTFSAFLIYLFLSISPTGSVLTQDFPEKALEKPKKYVLPSRDVGYKTSNDRNKAEYWIVYSDRSGNPTYTDASGYNRKSYIQFMDWFYVAEESNRRVRIIKDTSLQYGKFSKTAIDLGWVDKKKLLLWDHCLINNVTGSNEKVISVNIYLIELTPLKSKKTLSIPSYYYDPNLSHKSNNVFSTEDVYYIYKQSDDRSALLIGKLYYTAARQIKEDVLGWVDTAHVIEWNNHVTFEPNWDKSAADERKEKQLPICIFSSKYYASRYADCKKVSSKSIIWQDDLYDQRRGGSYLRFQILKTDTINRILKVGLMVKDENEDELVYTTGYAPLSISCLHNKLYKNEFLFSQQELGSLLTRVEELINAIKGNKKRKALQQYWFNLFAKNKGAVGAEFPDSLSINEASKLFFGVGGNCTFCDKELRSIANDDEVTEEMVEEFLGSLRKKRFQLEQIYNSEKYRYGFESNNIYYYWIQEELIP